MPLTIASLFRPSALALLAALWAGGARAADAEAEAAKLNHYVEGYNRLLGTFGLAEEYALYSAQKIAGKTVKDRFSVAVGWIDLGAEDLKAARAAAGGGLEELDAVGDRFIPAIGRLVDRLKGLDTYYKTRAYLEDNLARGKKEDPLALADFKDNLAMLDALHVALDKAIARRDEAELADLKRSGDGVGYDGGLALQKSKALIGLFADAKDMRDAARLKQGDELVALIEPALADLHKQLAAAKAGKDESHGMRDSFYDSVADRLESLVGAYRAMKRSGAAADFNAMVEAYNGAVEEANNGQ